MPTPPLPLPRVVPVPGAPAQPSARLQGLRVLAVATLLALVALGLAWELWLAPTGRGTLALKVLPLVAALPGLWRHRLYTYRWLSLLLWLYAAEGALRASTQTAAARALALAEIGLSLLLFAACVSIIRLRLRKAPETP